MRNAMGLQLWVPLILTVWVGIQPVRAASLGAASSGEPDRVEATPVQKVELAPMSDPAVQGAACLGFAAISMAAAYAAGPVEALMLMSGAQHVATSPSILFIPMFSILGGGACALAATATPSVDWLIDQSGNMGRQWVLLMGGWFSDRSEGGQGASARTNGLQDDDSEETPRAPTSLRPMTETELQSTGCIIGALAGLGASMATSPMEVAMLSSGATTIVSSTPLLGLGLLATIVGASCGIGSFVAVPMMALINHFSSRSTSTDTCRTCSPPP